MNDYGPQWNAKVKGKQAVMQKTTSNKPMVVAEVEILDGEHKGKTVLYRGLLNPEKIDQTERTIIAMESLGCVNFRVDPFGMSAFNGISRNTARAILTMEEDQNGVDRLIAKFINPDSLVKEESIASDADRNRWREQFGGVMQAIKQKKADAATANPPDPAEDDEKPNF